MRRGCFLILLALLTLLIAAPVQSHPTIDNSAEVVVARDRVAFRARISLVEVDIEHPVADARGTVDPARLAAAVQAHGAYLLAHLSVTADGRPLTGKIVSASPPAGPVKWEDFEEHEAAYEIRYPLAGPPAGKVRIEQDVLKEFSRLGQPWQVIFVATVRQEPEAQPHMRLLTRDQPLEYACHWDALAATTPATQATTESEHAPAAAQSASDARHVAWQYVVHGAMHILTGYDHLLFVAALVLGAARLWDLVKVVTAFAIAHTFTLTLSVLHLVRVPASVVEPMIAASIVFVALQNVFFPRQARGPARWAVAFGFGLFHGLGFAGGLMEAMRDMPAANLAVALASFTLGVELAHQLLIVPLYLVVRTVRPRKLATAPDPEAPLPPRAALPFSLRLASGVICVAGMFYLVGALRGA